eukprot:11206938-Lingulodinium_polyedra.AAC.1
MRPQRLAFLDGSNAAADSAGAPRAVRGREREARGKPSACYGLVLTTRDAKPYWGRRPVGGR